MIVKNMVKEKSCISLPADLNKAFDCILHDILIVYSKHYGLSYEA